MLGFFRSLGSSLEMITSSFVIVRGNLALLHTFSSAVSGFFGSAVGVDMEVSAGAEGVSGAEILT